MWYQVTVELPLREFYQVMPSEAISEEDWLKLTLTVIIVFQMVKCRHRLTSYMKPIRNVSKFDKTASAFHLFRCVFAI